MDYKNIIPKIKSIRNYKKDTVSSQILNELKEYYKNQRKLDENIEVEVLIKNKEEVYEELKNHAGYNDFMLEAPHYLLILSEEKENYIENTGYIGQNIMLKAFDLGVGSCWITFKDGDKIKEKLDIKSSKKLTALISLGFDDNKNKVVYENVSEYNPSKAEVNIVEDNVSYRLSPSDIVYIKKWGEKADVEELINRDLFDALNNSRYAPSTKNRQPWRFIVDDEIVILAVRSDSHTNDYERKIDTGIVMLYFESIIDSTLFDLSWNIGKPAKKYDIPDEYKIVGYCKM